MMNWGFRLYPPLYSASQNYCMNTVNFEIQTIKKPPWISGLMLTREIDTRVWFVYIFALTDTQYSTLVFPGIFVSASLPLILPVTGLTLSQKKLQIFLQLPLPFLFICTLFEEEYCCKERLAILSATSHNSSMIISKITMMWRKKVEHTLNLSLDLENWGRGIQQSLWLHGNIYIHL